MVHLNLIVFFTEGRCTHPTLSRSAADQIQIQFKTKTKQKRLKSKQIQFTVVRRQLT